MESEAYSRNVNPDFKILLFDKHYESLQRILIKVCKVIIVALMSYCLRRLFAKLLKATGGGKY